MATKIISQADEIESVDAARAFALVGVGRITGWRLIRNPNSGFPQPYRCDPTNPRSRLRFRLCELAQWIERQQRLTAGARVGIHAKPPATRAEATE